MGVMARWRDGRDGPMARSQVRRDGERLLFCVERAMEEGGYVKYNNNSGFVDWDEGGREHRLTPHAFSRFSFDESCGQLMVVDIQGVDDVYTDPQIHTLSGKDYGEGNLGVGGEQDAPRRLP